MDRRLHFSPDVFVPLDVDLVELSRHRRDEVLLHLHGHVLGQDREQEALLKSKQISSMHLVVLILNRGEGRSLKTTSSSVLFST